MPQPNVYIPARELIELGMWTSRDPQFNCDVDEPCPVCGMLGALDDSNEDRCVGDGSKRKE